MAGGYRPQPKDGYEKLVAEITELRRRVDALTNAAPNRNASIGGGDLVVLDTNGNVVMRIGHNSTGLRGFSALSAAGMDMLTFWAVGADGLPFLAIQDSTASVVTAGDPAGRGDGILWPYVPIAGGVMTIAQWGVNTTGTFTTLWQAGSNVFSQRLYIGCRTICFGGATAGQVRLLCNGVQVGSTIAVGTSAGDANFVGFVADTNGAYTYLEVQARVSAGVGSCAIQPYDTKWMNHG